MRCSIPLVPGIAQGRARVSGLRKYGRKSSCVSANSTDKSGNVATSGIFQGSEPLAMYPSESKNTGTRYVVAIRTASIAIVKQSLGVDAAITAAGDSPFRPNITCSKSACSVLVGRPVDGPPR
ncbi:unannotated protein [freshwater metagenome]|uniref:Unannotated protein n=1 Tax=freshwater metagenome TaxID=449393 RepID=A0A6J6TUV7_9ZZZZ